MPRRPDHAAASRGFTLLEVLVAFIIAALALGVMFDGVLGGMRAAAAAAHTETAIALARSRLAETLAAVQSGAIHAFSDQQGDDGHGFLWHVQVRPGTSVLLPRADLSQGTGIGQPGGPRAVLYGVTVTVGWSLDGGHRQVRLDGARLALIGVPSS